MKKITIINYGLGNIQSIANMFEKVGGTVKIANSLLDIATSERLVLPGVGAFDHGMEMIRRKKILPLLRKKIIEEHVPLLGICLGAQLLTEGSEEGKLKGIGYIKGKARKFVPTDISMFKVPHVGWNEIKVLRKNLLLKNLKSGSKFYFTHSYYLEIKSREDVVASTDCGFEFTSIFNKDNIYGVQFHPEKSHVFGMTLFDNFLRIS